MNNQSKLNPTEKNEKWGYMDPAKRWVIEPVFDYADEFQNGMARVRMGWPPEARYGLIDPSGKFLLRPEFEELGVLSEGLIPAAMKHRYGFINKKGVWVIKPSYEQALEFSQGLAAVKIKGRWGYIDRKGRQVITPQYVEAESFIGGLAKVLTSKGLRIEINPQNKPINRIDEFKKLIDALVHSPKKAELWLQVGVTLDNVDKAEEPMEPFLETAPQTFCRKLTIERCFREAVARNPKLKEGWHRLARYLYDCEKYDDAKACFQQLTKLDASNQEAWHYLGYCHQIKAPSGIKGHGQRDEALRCFKRTVAKNARNAAIKFETQYWMAESALANGDKKQALRYFKEQVRYTNDEHCLKQIQKLEKSNQGKDKSA